MTPDELIDFIMSEVTPKPDLEDIRACVARYERRAQTWAKVSGYGPKADEYVQKYLQMRSEAIVYYWHKYGRAPRGPLLTEWGLTMGQRHAE